MRPALLDSPAVWGQSGTPDLAATPGWLEQLDRMETLEILEQLDSSVERGRPDSRDLPVFPVEQVRRVVEAYVVRMAPTGLSGQLVSPVQPGRWELPASLELPGTRARRAVPVQPEVPDSRGQPVQPELLVPLE